MGNNLFISYDLLSPGQNYENVAQGIKSLGPWARVNLSFWYVNSSYSVSQAAEIVWRSMDKDDRLVVVDTTNNVASWYNLLPEVAEQIKKQWLL